MADRARGIARDIPNHFASIPGNTRVEATAEVGESGFPDLKELRNIFEEVDIAPLVSALNRQHRSVGRRPYPRGPMIRAFQSMPVLGIADISSLHRRLMNDPALRYSCGFTTRVPSRPTLSRVYSQLGKESELMDECHAQTVSRLKEYRPDLGEEVAVDSTMVKTNSNRRREPLSDPEASWGRRNNRQAEKGWEWVYGYRPHVAADARHGVPLAQIVTPGNESDMNYLKPLVEKLQWRPEVVIADRGYDSADNNEWLHRRGIAPVIHKRRPPKGFHTRGRGRGRKYYSERGTPLCECKCERPYLGTDPETGERVYGPVTDCERGGKLKGFSLCEVEVRVNPEDDIRLFGGAIRRDSLEFTLRYNKRPSSERVFSRWKDHNVLESHSFRGLSKVRLLLQLYAIAEVAAKIVEVKNADTLGVAA